MKNACHVYVSTMGVEHRIPKDVAGDVKLSSGFGIDRRYKCNRDLIAYCEAIEKAERAEFERDVQPT